MGTQVVWFKRDLRLRDHEPLTRAIQAGPTLGFFVIEPSWLHAPTTDASHVRFLVESLSELRSGFEAAGGILVVAVGEFPDLLDRLHEQHRFERLWSHEETGDARSYARDLRVREWCRLRGVEWIELPQFGVIRGQRDHRKRWAQTWTERMTRPIRGAPERVPPPSRFAFTSPDARDRNGVHRCGHAVPTLHDLGCGPSRKEAQTGGESQALSVLDSFLSERGAHYPANMSSPVTAWEGCSRLSPYLAFGNVSMRHVYQETQLRLRKERVRRRSSNWTDALESFESRLRWHCHFIQKLEDEPTIESENMNRSYDGLRVEDPESWTPDQKRHFDAWCAGRTGFPMVDAAMRCLHQTGWMNFRMRAMLVSFVSHQLWLHWRPAAAFLAQHFLDYEPGIHYSQFQMQSGTTGMNTTRIYSPAKQAREQDPDGSFIHRYVPELSGVPPEHLAEPHNMSHDLQCKTGCLIGRDYPAPLVDPRRAYLQARTRLERMKQEAHREGRTAAVVERHGSRRPSPFGRGRPGAARGHRRGRA
ncbi:MAG: FAD-binding domain-containing protein [Myxococcota bacterium]